MKLKKKHKNMILLIILILCICFVIHDFYMIAIKPWITHETAGWTYFGFITFIIAAASGLLIIDYFIKEINK